MTDDYDMEAAKRLIYDDNVNVTESNPLKEFAKICVQLALIIIFVYFSIYIVSGIVLKSLPIEKQIAIENFMSPSLKYKSVELADTEKQRLEKIKNNILKVDKKFPKTSNLEIGVIEEKQLNALCYPNGNIYITSSLYKELDTDEKLTFVIAHEMAHYRHKDHLLNLRRNISNGVVLILLSVANPNNSQISNIAEGGLSITDLKFSRGAEENADKYAIKISNILYGNSKAGAEVMKTLKDKNIFDVEFLSTHPNIDKRIKYINKSSK